MMRNFGRKSIVPILELRQANSDDTLDVGKSRDGALSFPEGVFSS
jgi:hypothetical protein